MKLPDIQYRGQLNLGREDIGQAGREYSAKSRAAQAVQGAITDYQNIRTNSQINSADVEMTIFESELKKKYEGQLYADGSELPDYLDVKRTDAEGNPLQVPMSDVWPEIYRTEMSNKAKALSGQIGNNRASDEWLKGSTIRVEQRYQGHQSAAFNQIKTEAAELDKNNAAKLVANGLFAPAKEIIKTSESLLPSEKESLIARVNEVEIKEKTSQYEQAVEFGSLEASRLARSGDDVGAQDQMLGVRQLLDDAVNDGIYSKSEANEIYRENYQDYHKQSLRRDYQNIFDQRGFDAAMDSLYKRSGTVPKGWDSDDWNAYVKSQVGDLKRWKKDKDKSDSFDGVQKRLDGDDRVVLSQKEVDDYFEERVIPLTEGQPVEVRNAVIQSYVEKTKIVPTGLRDQVSTWIRSGNPELMRESVDIINRINSVQGVTGDIVSKNEEALAQTAVELSQSMDGAEAVTKAWQLTNPNDKARIEQVNATIKDMKDKEATYIKKSNAVFNSIFSLNPDVDSVASAVMGKEYGAAFEASLKAGMTESNAHKSAERVIKRSWSEWEGRVTKFAPDVYYGMNDGDNEWIKKDIVDSVNEMSLAPVGFDQIILGQDDDLARTASTGKPTYPVGVIQEDGTIFWFPTRGKNAVRWMPDRDAEMERRLKESEERSANRRQSAIKKEQEAGQGWQRTTDRPEYMGR